MLKPADRRVRNVGEDVGKPGLRVNVVELGAHDQCRHERRTFSTTIRSGEEPRLPAEREAPQRPLGSIVRQANPAVF
ncbi:hypothetical protein AX761_24245 [Rhizobium sp. 58]|nr:hypothetical protein AX761_24245 [Rhizobium sp. 58]